MNDNMKIKYFDDELEVYDERRVVNKNTYSITLNYIPSPTRPLTVENGKTTLTETNGTPNANQYVLDRENGLLLFNQAMKGKVMTINYSAIGLWCISADKVYTNVDNKGKIVETLEDLMRENRQTIESIKTVGDAFTVITQLQADIDSVTGLAGNIAEGLSVNEELTKSITSGKGTNTTLTNTISSADTKIKEMNTWILQHGDIVNLDNRVDTVETEIPKINGQLDKKVNKEQGKDLSTNDFTNLEKSEVAKIKDKLDKVSLLNLTYPVGSIYISINSVNPEELFGGSWVEFAKGQTLVGVDTTQTEFNTVLKTGGEKKSSEFNCGNRGYGLTIAGGLGYTERTIIRTAEVGGYEERNAEISLLQPYVTVYMWQRTK